METIASTVERFPDQIDAGEGNDVGIADDGASDTIQCGGGSDSVIVDGND